MLMLASRREGKVAQGDRTGGAFGTGTDTGLDTSVEGRSVRRETWYGMCDSHGPWSGVNGLHELHGLDGLVCMAWFGLD